MTAATPNVASYTRPDGQVIYLCELCNDRQFTGPDAFLTHCRTSPVHTGKWCERHKFLVATKTTMEDHFATAPDHNICRFCDVDFSEMRPLFQHVWATHHYCFRCRRDRNQCKANLKDYADHEEEVHGVCPDCGSQFATLDALHEHRKVHLSRPASSVTTTTTGPTTTSTHSLVCPACELIFDSVASVILHHESNTCTRGMTLTFIDQLAMLCDPEDRLRTQGPQGKPQYRCPKCEFRSEYISGVVGHAEEGKEGRDGRMGACRFDLTSRYLTKFCGVTVGIRR